jgi:hypothetical protein
VDEWKGMKKKKKKKNEGIFNNEKMLISVNRFATAMGNLIRLTNKGEKGI